MVRVPILALVGVMRHPAFGSGISAPRLFLPGMLAFGVLLLFGGFTPEAYKAAHLFEEIFSARLAPVGSAAA